ncbi:hypothetical protein F4780DRAFT_58524 [Xylariomycetidae sp. FL0641]|nr:hypothetical protein F4780DRAFT_58524 [Xylariomycetidae sp. FL0641]
MTLTRPRECQAGTGPGQRRSMCRPAPDCVSMQCRCPGRQSQRPRDRGTAGPRDRGVYGTSWCPCRLASLRLILLQAFAAYLPRTCRGNPERPLPFTSSSGPFLGSPRLPWRVLAGKLASAGGRVQRRRRPPQTSIRLHTADRRYARNSNILRVNLSGSSYIARVSHQLSCGEGNSEATHPA